MSQMWHIVRKDLRRLRWVWLAWCTLVIAETVLRVLAAPVAFSGLGPREAVTQIATTLGILHAVLTVAIVSAVVHDEPLVGEDAFWVTRPVKRGSLMAAKLVALGCSLILIPLLSALAVMAAFASTPMEMLTATPPFVLQREMLISPLLVIAVLTRSLTRYIFTLAGVVATVAALIAGTFTASLLRGGEDVPAGYMGPPDPTLALIGLLSLVAAGVAVVAYQYYRRRRGRALVVAALGLVAATLLPGLWPWSLAAAAPTPSSAPPDSANITVVVDSSSPPRLSDNFGVGFNPAATVRHQVSARLLVSGMPGDVDAQPVVRRSTFTVPGLASFAGPDGGVSVYTTLGGNFNFRTIAAALGNVRVLNEPSQSPSEHWASVLRVSNDQLATVAGQTGDLELDLGVRLHRTTIVAALSLQSGSVAESERHRFTTLGAVRGPTGALLLLRMTHVEPLLAWPSYRQFVYALVNRVRGEAVTGGYPHDLTPASLFGAVGFERTNPAGFVVREIELQFPQRYGPVPSSFTIDADWLSDAELVILEARPAGGVDRRVTVRGFTIPAR